MRVVLTDSLRGAGSLAPFVSIGRSRPDLVQPAILPPRTATQILADRDTAQAEREALEASRADLLLTGNVDEIAALNHRIALTKVRQDQAEAQHAAAVIAEARAKDEHDVEQARRKTLRKAAVKANTESAKLSIRYVAMAKEMAALLGQLRDHERVITEANQNLPVDAEPVPYGDPLTGTPGVPQNPLSCRPYLPGLGPDASPIWGARHFVNGEAR